MLSSDVKPGIEVVKDGSKQRMRVVSIDDDGKVELRWTKPSGLRETGTAHSSELKPADEVRM